MECYFLKKRLAYHALMAQLLFHYKLDRRERAPVNRKSYQQLKKKKFLALIYILVYIVGEWTLGRYTLIQMINTGSSEHPVSKICVHAVKLYNKIIIRLF